MTYRIVRTSRWIAAAVSSYDSTISATAVGDVPSYRTGTYTSMRWTLRPDASTSVATAAAEAAFTRWIASWNRWGSGMALGAGVSSDAAVRSVLS